MRSAVSTLDDYPFNMIKLLANETGSKDPVQQQQQQQQQQLTAEIITLVLYCRCTQSFSSRDASAKCAVVAAWVFQPEMFDKRCLLIFFIVPYTQGGSK